MILLSGRIFALIRQLSFVRKKGFAITREPADQVGAEGRKRCTVSLGKQGLGRGAPVFSRVEING
jgi:hypothetical protein